MANENQLHLQNIIQYISAFFSVIINVFLIALIHTKSPKQLGAYKYLMMCISIHEIGYSFIDITVSPLFHSYGSTFLIIVITKDRILSPAVLLILNSIYCGFFAFSLAAFALHFVYRYLVASGNKKLLQTFNGWKFFLWLAVPILYGVSWSIETYFLVEPTDATMRYAADNILEVLDLQESEFVYNGAYFYEKVPGGDYMIHWKPIIGIMVMLVYITLSLIIVFVFSIKCYFRINALVSKANTSRVGQVLQTQLFYALVTQALIPIILMHLPVGVMFVFTFLEWNIGSLSAIVSITIALFPAIDPLPTIFMVKHYRKGVFEWSRSLKAMFTGKEKSSNITITSVKIAVL